MAQVPDTPVAGEGSKQKDVKDKDVKQDGKPKAEDKVEELSEEDAKLKESLEGMVTRASQGASALASVSKAVEDIGNEIRTATTSMTSVPKPLKFLLPHYDTLKQAHEQAAQACKAPLADIISVLGTVAGKEEDRDCLKYRLLGTGVDPGSWGHEYLRHVAGEIAAEYAHRSTEGSLTADLMELVKVLLSCPVPRPSGCWPPCWAALWCHGPWVELLCLLSKRWCACRCHLATAICARQLCHAQALNIRQQTHHVDVVLFAQCTAVTAVHFKRIGSHQ